MKKIFIMVCILLISYSAMKIFNIQNEESKNMNVYSSLQMIHDQGKNSSTHSDTEYIKEIAESVNLIDINYDYLGWISMDQTSINYPVVQSHDNKDYLNRSFIGQWSIYGTPFLDKDTRLDDPYKIIYGHSDDTKGQMFTNLKHLLDTDYYMQHRIIQCFDKDYEVVSVNVVDINKDLPYWEIPQLNQNEQKNIIDAYKNASMIPIKSSNQSNQSNDYILLSTCLIDAGEDTRLLVIAQCVDGSTSTIEGGSIE